jgi:hypothetical protein
VVAAGALGVGAAVEPPPPELHPASSTASGAAVSRAMVRRRMTFPLILR